MPKDDDTPPKPDTAKNGHEPAPERPAKRREKESGEPPHLPPGAMGDWASL